MARKYKRLNYEDRKAIEAMCKQGKRAEEIAEFKTKEDCMLVIYAIFKGMEQDSKAVEVPTQEEMEKQKDLIKQLAEAGQEVAAGIEDLLKEMFNGE